MRKRMPGYTIVLAPVLCVTFVTSQVLTASPYESQIKQIQVHLTTSKFVQPVSEAALAQLTKLSHFASRIAPPSKLPAHNWLLDDSSSDGSRVPELAFHAPAAVSGDMANEDYSVTYVWGVAAVVAAGVTVGLVTWPLAPVAGVAATVVAVAATINAYEAFTEGKGSAALAEAQAEANAAQNKLAAQENVPTQEAAQEVQATVEAIEEVAATNPEALAATEQWVEQEGVAKAHPRNAKELYVVAKRKLMLSTELDSPSLAL